MSDRLFKMPFKMPCEVYGCLNPAEYTVGNPSGPPNSNYSICRVCLAGLVKSIPKEFLPKNDDELESKILAQEKKHADAIKKKNEEIRLLKINISEQKNALKDLNNLLKVKK